MDLTKLIDEQVAALAAVVYVGAVRHHVGMLSPYEVIERQVYDQIRAYAKAKSYCLPFQMDLDDVRLMPWQCEAPEDFFESLTADELQAFFGAADDVVDFPSMSQEALTFALSIWGGCEDEALKRGNPDLNSREDAVDGMLASVTLEGNRALLFLEGKEAGANLTVEWVVNVATDHDLEKRHNWVQWAFPLDTPSKANPFAPTVTHQELLAMSPTQAENLRAMLDRYMRFLDDTIHWRHPNDHNHLRISRVIKCLRLAGWDTMAEQVYEFAVAVGNPSPNGKAHWDTALKHR